jgi:hypothetical protein
MKYFNKENLLLWVLSIGAAYQKRRGALGGLWDLGVSLILVTILVLVLALDHKTGCTVNALSPGSPIGALVYHHLSKQSCGGNQ